ncbi:MAG: LysR substrate-binding domain-containing protein [Burkholderiaceae bacterium]
MKLSALRDFLAAADRGSLRAAARQMGSAQPAISHSIQELEKELGVPLFERHSTGVSLTPMGGIFQRRARAVFNELRHAREELDQLRGLVHGHLTVALSSVPHVSLLPYALSRFRQRYPQVKMEIIDAVYPNVEAQLRDGSIDCYIGPAPDEPAPGLLVEKLFDNTRVIVGRKGHPLAHARSLRELVDAEWITTSITHKAEEELGPLFAQHGLPSPKLVLQAHSALSFQAVMAYSDLLMMLPVQWIRSPLLKSAVRPIHVRELLPAPPICLVRYTALPLTPAAEYFCDLMRRAARHEERAAQSLAAPGEHAAGRTAAAGGTAAGGRTATASRAGVKRRAS